MNSTNGGRLDIGYSPADIDDDGNDGTEETFDWPQHLTETKTTPASSEWFWQPPAPPDNKFEVGQKLEAVDPRNNAITSVATVIAVFGPKIKLRLDGAGKTNDFWTLIDTSKIHRFGFTEESGGHLQPPLSYEKDPVRYQTIINAAKKSGKLAPDACFFKEPPRPPINMFKIGTKLEATDTRNPTQIFPAQVIGREREKIKIEYIGWDQKDLIRYDSRDIYPCGWWGKAGCPVSRPPDLVKRKDLRALTPYSQTASRRRGRPSRGPDSAEEPSQSQPWHEYQNIFEAVMVSPLTTSPTTTPAQDGQESASSVSSDSMRKPNVAGKLEAAVKDNTALAPKHHARKSIAAARPPVLDAAATDKKSIQEKPPMGGSGLKNGAPSRPAVISGRLESVPEGIPAPDKVVDSEIVTLHLNANCNGGPHLDIPHLVRLHAESKREVIFSVAICDAMQMLINCARPESAVLVFNNIPTADMKDQKTLCVTGTAKNGRGLLRYIPWYKSPVSGNRALSDMLKNLGACPNLICTTIKKCNSCGESPAAKKSKYENDVTVAVDDLDAKDKQILGETSGVARLDVQEAPWWSGQDPSKWSTKVVERFICSVADAHSASQFRREEIDGPALVLLTSEIMIKHMGVRVGPTIKISNAIERLKGTNRPNYTTTTQLVPRPDAGNADQ